MNRASRQHGFTLIEVVVAFAIFALSVGAIYEVFTAAQRRTAQTIYRAQALLLARSLLSQQRASPGPWPIVQHGNAGNGTRWQVEVHPHPSGTHELGRWHAYDVEVDVGPVDSVVSGTQLRSVELVHEPGP